MYNQIFVNGTVSQDFQPRFWAQNWYQYLGYKQAKTVSKFFFVSGKIRYSRQTCVGVRVVNDYRYADTYGKLLYILKTNN